MAARKCKSLAVQQRRRQVADLQIRNTALIVETAIELQRQYGADWFGVEVNQFQQLLANDLRRVAHEHRIMLPICQITNTVNKLVRIRRLTPFLSHGMIRFKGGSKGAKLLVEQLRDFPNADHDDGPDALEMGGDTPPQIVLPLERRELGSVGDSVAPVPGLAAWR